jgi:hypothetical protein
VASGFALTIPQFPANNGRHETRTLIGLGNRCSILLSYGAVADFVGFQRGAVKNRPQNAQGRTFHVGT